MLPVLLKSLAQDLPTVVVRARYHVPTKQFSWKARTEGLGASWTLWRRRRSFTALLRQYALQHFREKWPDGYDASLVAVIDQGSVQMWAAGFHHGAEIDLRVVQDTGPSVVLDPYGLEPLLNHIMPPRSILQYISKNGPKKLEVPPEASSHERLHAESFGTKSEDLALARALLPLQTPKTCICIDRTKGALRGIRLKLPPASGLPDVLVWK